MQLQRIVIVYATTYGQTAKIAHRIAETLEKRGALVTVVDAARVPATFVLQDFDLAILGASILFSRHQPALARFARAHRDVLNGMPAAFFSVSGGAAQTDQHARTEVQHFISNFLRDTGWSPALTTTFGGAMAFTKYNPLLRFFMKRISARAGGSTDTSRDYEMTDWDAVEKFALSAATLVQSQPSGKAGTEAVQPTH